MSDFILDANGKPVGDAAQITVYLNEQHLMDASSVSPSGEVTEESVTPNSKLEEQAINLTPGASFILFRSTGEYVMHLGPENHVQLNPGGFFVTFCTWAMNNKDWVEQFREFLANLAQNPEGLDDAIEKAVNEASEDKKS